MDSCPSLVQAIETTASEAPYVSYRVHLQDGDPTDMDYAETAYAGSAKMDPHKKLASLRACRTDAWFVRHKVTGEVRVSSATCKLRWCPFCAAARRSFVAREVAEWIPAQKYPKFMTLTVQHTDDDLETQIQNLYDDFRKFRKMKWFKDRCTGGIWFFQVKLSDTDDRWHPHLHCIVTGRYLPHERLSREWAKATSGSYIVDIQMVKDHKSAANEVARYCATPVSLGKLSDTGMSEVVDAFHGRRLCGTWGTGRTMSFRQKSDTVAEEWQNLGTWSLVTRLAEFDQDARAILFAYKTGDPLPEYSPLTDYITEVPEDYEIPPPGKERWQMLFTY